MPEITSCWVHDNTFLFVDNDDFAVFIHNIQRDVLGFYLWGLVNLEAYANLVTGLYAIGALHRAIVDKNLAVMYQFLGQISR